jgi:Cdc6-like AAA superfamily ATPase
LISKESRRQYIDAQTASEPNFADFVGATETNYIVLVAGPPVSGKTLLANRLLDYIRTNSPTTSGQIYKYSGKAKEVDKIAIDIVKKLNILESTGKFCTIITGQFGRPDVRDRVFGMIEELRANYIFEVVYVELKTPIEICRLFNQFRLQITRDKFLIETPAREIQKYFKYAKDVRDGSISFELSYIEFPFILREKEELFYYY